MSKYSYYIQNYKAIKKAEININGITVLAGENGSGKSTLSRWLYYVINGAAKFDLILSKEYINYISDIIHQWNIIMRDITRNLYIQDLTNNNHSSYIKMAGEQLEQLLITDKFDSNNIEEAKRIFSITLELFANQLKIFLNSDALTNRKNRILNFLNIEKSTNDHSIVVEQYKTKQIRTIEKITEKLYKRLEQRSLNDLYQLISYQYKESDNPPQNMDLKEDNVVLFENSHIANIYNLTNAIYVDTPMSITSNDSDNVFWKELSEMMFHYPNNEISLETKAIVKRVNNIIGGEVKLVDNLFNEELRYLSSDKSIDIELDKAATGIKTFSYIQRLLQNGYLTNKTLLLIDEPEAHLHPQWIVEYARLLIYIHKYLGTKIMIASHNPDMVAAIRSISEKENILECTHFYIAKKDMRGQYSYKDLGKNIEEIFESFNIALERINLYGANNI